MAEADDIEQLLTFQEYFRSEKIGSAAKSIVESIINLLNKNYQVPETQKSAADLLSNIQKRLIHLCQKAKSSIETVDGENESQDIVDLRQAIKALENHGNNYLHTGQEFTSSPNNVYKKEAAIVSARELLKALIKLLMCGNICDLSKVIQKAQMTDDALGVLADSRNVQQISDRYSTFTLHVDELTETTKRLIKDLKSGTDKEDMRAIMSATIRGNQVALYSAISTYIEHPESKNARVLRDTVYTDITDGLKGIIGILDEEEWAYNSIGFSHLGYISDLMANMENLQNSAYMKKSMYRQNRDRQAFEEKVEEIVRDCGQIADLSLTRKDRKSNIVTECNGLRQTMQCLLQEYENRETGRDHMEDIDDCFVKIMMNLKDLKRQLRRAVIDHVSDVLIDKHAPLLRLTNAASEGNQRETQKSALEFETYDQNLRNVAELACQLSTDVEGIKSVRYLAQQLEKTSNEVLFAAHILAEFPDCKKSKENMFLFKNNWIRNCDLLTSAIDNLMDVNDFLAVTEKHLESDCVELLLGYRKPNYGAFKSSSNKIKGRCHRIEEVVNEYLESLSPSSNSDAIKDAISILRNETLPNFDEMINNYNEEDNSLDENDLISSYETIFKDIKDIRTAVLKSRNFDEVDSDNEYDEDAMTTTGHESKSQISDGENLSRAIKKMPLDERKKIEGQMAVFSIVRKNFVEEICKWDENGNDIIIIAKQMCKIMTDMTAFTRNGGPYKKTSDIILAAQEISSLGKRLRELAQMISDESVESFTKKDLTGYISSIDMLCTQLLITSRVKANVEQTGGDFKVINLDSVISLIQNGKNLLDVVVSTVKSAYIASTKHRDKTSNKPRFEWKMAPPQKISIIKQQETKKRHDIIRKESLKFKKAPLTILQEFSSN